MWWARAGRPSAPALCRRQQLPDLLRVSSSSSSPGAVRGGCSAPAASSSESDRTRAGLPNDGKTLADFFPQASAPATGLGSGSGASSGLKAAPLRKPSWLKMYNPNLSPETAERYKHVRSTIKKTGLATVCQEAKCPNIGECWSAGTATVMIMGDTCTRGCRFCSVATSRKPPPLNPDEPESVATAVEAWNLDYIVLTMVDRDDLPDQGAGHVKRTVQQLKERDPKLRVETLVGDFQGRTELVDTVISSGMDVFAHNIETVRRLTSTVRDHRAGYDQTLAVLRHAKQARPDVVTKSSVMLGMGETAEEIQQVMLDLRDAGVEIVTFGQYLQPTKRHMKVTRYVTPDEFAEYKVAGEALGLAVASGPLVRSSYRAGDFFKELMARRARAAEGSLSPNEVTLDLSRPRNFAAGDKERDASPHDVTIDLSRPLNGAAKPAEEKSYPHEVILDFSRPFNDAAVPSVSASAP